MNAITWMVLVLSLLKVAGLSSQQNWSMVKAGIVPWTAWCEIHASSLAGLSASLKAWSLVKKAKMGLCKKHCGCGRAKEGSAWFQLSMWKSWLEISGLEPVLVMGNAVAGRSMGKGTLGQGCWDVSGERAEWLWSWINCENLCAERWWGGAGRGLLIFTHVRLEWQFPINWGCGC